MSNWGTADALFCPDGDPPEDVLALPANAPPPLVLNVGYPAGKLVSKPGRLVMVFV
jgi:hypothetical protein